MPDLADGEWAEVQGSTRLPYIIKNVAGVYSCSCPAWRNQSLPIERRTCKHIRQFRGEEAESQRLGDLSSLLAAEPKSKPVAPALLLAEIWDLTHDPAGWWLSEKLDGVRAYWDGTRFQSRRGNEFYAPDWFTAGFPSIPLDGELWLARKAFQRTVSIVRRQDKSDLWGQMSYLVFDAPAVEAPFEERLDAVHEYLASGRPYFVAAHQQKRCRDEDHLRQELARVESLGGEGLMLRQPGSRYEAGRSSTLLKVKTFHDADARVVEHLPGTGRHKGRLGALAVELPDGTSFSVGTGFSDTERENPPAIGSTITFRYQELSDRGVPRFPSFVRIRHDVGQAVPAPAASGFPASTIHLTRPESNTMFRRFEFVEGSSSKFWEVTVADSDVTVRYGRIGTGGQRLTKSFADPAAAQKHADKLVGEKSRKGYRETTSSAA